MKNVLIVTGSDLAMEGTVSFTVTWIENAPKGFNFTWYFTGSVKDYTLRDKLISLGVRLISGNRGKMNTGGILPIKALRTLHVQHMILSEMRRINKTTPIDIIHVNTSGYAVATFTIGYAKRIGIKKRVVYCVNNPILNKWYHKIIKKISYRSLNKNATAMTACSRLTAEYMFGQYAEKAMIINPCTDCKKFIYSPEARKRIRDQYGIKDNFVVGNMARLAAQKNHKFLVEIFKEISEMDDNSRLMIVGDGPLRTEIIHQVEEYGLTDKVIFCGSTDKPEDYFCAMDVFVFPCIYEGLGQVAIHAQNAGLRTICSEEIPQETAVTDLIEYLPLSDSPQKWATEILKYAKGYERKNMYESIKAAGYDITSIPEYIRKVYN